VKVSVDSQRCEAHGMCGATVPDFFTLDTDGYSSVGADKRVPEGREKQIRIGVESCPVAALAIHDD
jgi:ferredoxin